MLPDGFKLLRGWAAHVDLTTLEAAIAWEQSSIRMFGKPVALPRLTAWMGNGAYTYSGIRHEPKALPGIVRNLHERVQLATACTFNSVLGNLYRGGADSVSWHADDEPELGPDPVIASLSFGAARTFAIRHNLSRTTYRVELQHGDLLIMGAGTQRAYQHQVPKTAKPCAARINLTFRTVLA